MSGVPSGTVHTLSDPSGMKTCTVMDSRAVAGFGAKMLQLWSSPTSTPAGRATGKVVRLIADDGIDHTIPMRTIATTSALISA